MEITVQRRPPHELLPMHELYCQEAGCQLVHHSYWSRGFVNTYAIELDGEVAGHGAVSNREDCDILEFYPLPQHRRHSLRMFQELIHQSGAKSILAQTNVPLMLRMLLDFGTEFHPRTVLFADAYPTRLSCPPRVTFRRKKESGELPIFEHHMEPEGDWLLEKDGAIVATGGFLLHYNPPYADLFMEVAEPHRRTGLGSYLIQRLKEACYASGKKPGARCDIGNIASRRTLEKAGMLACGHIVAARIENTPPS